MKFKNGSEIVFEDNSKNRDNYKGDFMSTANTPQERLKEIEAYKSNPADDSALVSIKSRDFNFLIARVKQLEEVLTSIAFLDEPAADQLMYWEEISLNPNNTLTPTILNDTILAREALNTDPLEKK